MLGLKAVIFDFDGTILDTETPEFRAWESLYLEHGTILEPLDWVHCIGTANAFDPHLFLEQKTGLTLDRASIRSRQKAVLEPLLHAELLRPGVRETILAAESLGLKLGVASSSSHHWVETWLDKFGLRSHFHCIKGKEDVESVKPDPALYLRSLEALGVKANEALALEDSLNGLRAARSAGIFTVVVPNTMTSHLNLEEADLLLESLLDLKLDAFCPQINKDQAMNGWDKKHIK